MAVLIVDMGVHIRSELNSQQFDDGTLVRSNRFIHIWRALISNIYFVINSAQQDMYVPVDLTLK